MVRHLAKFLLLLGVALASTPAWADTKTGLAAFRNQQYQRAYNELIGPARQGDRDAQYTVGFMIAQGHIAGDLPTARRWFQQAAEQGHGEAMAIYGYSFLYAAFGKPDGKPALAWITKAVQAGSPTAMVDLARFHAAGFLVAEDMGRTEQLLRDAAKTRDAAAVAVQQGFQNSRGEYFYSNALRLLGIGAMAQAAALRLAVKSAELKDRDGNYLAGILHKFGVGTPRDTAASIPYLTRATDAGQVDATFQLGKSYEMGFGVPIDTAKALGLYDRAAAKGHGLAKAEAQRLRSPTPFGFFSAEGFCLPWESRSYNPDGCRGADGSSSGLRY